MWHCGHCIPKYRLNHFSRLSSLKRHKRRLICQISNTKVPSERETRHCLEHTLMCGRLCVNEKSIFGANNTDTRTEPALNIRKSRGHPMVLLEGFHVVRDEPIEKRDRFRAAHLNTPARREIDQASTSFTNRSIFKQAVAIRRG